MVHSLGKLRGDVRVSVILLAGSMLLSACSRSSDEEQLRAALGTMQLAIEARQPSDFIDHVAKDFTAPEAGMDQRQVHDLLRVQVLRNERIGVSTIVRELRVEGDRASVTLTATLTGSAGGWLPERGSVYTVTSGWRKDDSDWKLIQANWQRSL